MHVHVFLYPKEELDDLKSVMDHIASEQWDQLSSDKI